MSNLIYMLNFLKFYLEHNQILNEWTDFET